MRKNIVSIISGIFCVWAIFLTSCTKMDHYYKDYVIERTYVGKPDSIWVQPGDQRVRIGILTPKDAEAKDLVISWGTDSMVVPIDHNVERQFILVEDLEERDYVFNAYTIDRKGNRSLPIELSTTVYGDAFRNTMRERNLSYSVVFPDSIAIIWTEATLLPEALLGNEIEFTDNAGVKQNIFVPRTQMITMLHDADPDKAITLKSAYRPHANAFEYFYTETIDLDLVATKRNSLTFSSASYTDAVYVDFKLVRGFLEVNVPTPLGADIDMCYALGAGSRGNLFTIDGTGFSAFAAAWQNAINAWPVRNVAKLKLDRTAGAVALYDGLDEMDREQMATAYNNSTGTPSNRLSSLAVNDIIFLHSEDRDLYVAIKVTGTPPNVSGALGDFTIEFKVSRP